MYQATGAICTKPIIPITADNDFVMVLDCVKDDCVIHLRNRSIEAV